MISDPALGNGRVPTGIRRGLPVSEWRKGKLGIRDERRFLKALTSVMDALAIPPTWWVPSFLGLPSSWGWWGPAAKYSEYQLLWSGDVPRLAEFLWDIGIPSVPGRAPQWVPRPVASLFWHPSRLDWCPDPDRGMCTYPDEAWFFINGILTDDALARMNGDYLAYLFRRPITLLQNSTDGAPIDLLECGIERLGATADDVDAAFPPLMKALKDPKKKQVVVIAHSQGTLIAAVVLKLLKRIQKHTSACGDLSEPAGDDIHREARAEGMRFDRADLKSLTVSELAKLELYCFANCASNMQCIQTPDGFKFPWIESFGNQHDIVARLGVVAPHPDRDGIHIDGPRYEHCGQWGHLLNVHYLMGTERAQSRAVAGRGTAENSKPYYLLNPELLKEEQFSEAAVPRLYGYLGGRRNSPTYKEPHELLVGDAPEGDA